MAADTALLEPDLDESVVAAAFHPVEAAIVRTYLGLPTKPDDSAYVEGVLETDCGLSVCAGECRRVPIPDVGQLIRRLSAVSRKLTSARWRPAFASVT